jgi:hypothetical protein
MSFRSSWKAATALAVTCIATTYVLTSGDRNTPHQNRQSLSQESQAENLPPTPKKHRQAEQQSAMFAAMSSAAAAEPPAPTKHQPNSPWESALYNIYERASEPEKIAEQLSALLPTLPSDGQAETARYLVAVLDATNYMLAVNLWQDPRLGQEARNVLLEDLGQRPHEVSGPFWAAIAARPSHPLHATAVARSTDPGATFSKPEDPK